ncbi:MAG TPA: trigger factor, partial [Actinomycetota bacterium]|nr:trigger factor [Actinomycetota bacterium]
MIEYARTEPMQTTLEETAKHTVRLVVEVPPEEFARDLDRAYRKVAGQVKIPGFRKGKVPRQIIDSRVGREVVLEEFVHDSLPRYYADAIREHALAPIAEPEIDLDDLEEGKSLKFTATVEVRPRLELAPEEYRGVSVDRPEVEPSEREIDEYVDRLRERFAELEAVARPARQGDYVLADVRATRHGEDVPEATRVGFHSEVGSNELVPELDKELEGKRKGDIVKFNAMLPESFGELAGTEVTFQALVKEVKAKRLPDADDEFAKTASEFDTVAELREDLRGKLSQLKEAEATAVVRDQVLRTLVDRIDVDLPERLVDDETESRVERATQRAEQAGTTLDAALAEQGWDELRFRSDARAHAIRALKADLVLEAVARQEELTVTDEDLGREVAALSQATGRDVKDVARLLQKSGQVTALAGDIIRSKALDLLVEAANVTSGGLPEPPPAEPEPPHEQG